jgi:hypothetical protein
MRGAVAIMSQMRFAGRQGCADLVEETLDGIFGGMVSSFRLRGGDNGRFAGLISLRSFFSRDGLRIERKRDE